LNLEVVTGELKLELRRRRRSKRGDEGKNITSKQTKTNKQTNKESLEAILCRLQIVLRRRRRREEEEEEKKKESGLIAWLPFRNLPYENNAM